MYQVTQRTVDIVSKFQKLVNYKYHSNNKTVTDRDITTLYRLLYNAYDFYGHPKFDNECFWRQAEKLIANRRAQKKRIKKYIKGMFLSYDVLYFLTLTYSDATINKSTFSSKRQTVTRFLDSISRDYIGNSDIGKTNQRLHFHAVVALKTDYDPIMIAAEWRSKYGNLNFRKINVSRLSTEKLSKYMSKLTNHAGKLGTSRSFHKRTKDGFKEVDNIDWLLEFEKIS